ncbi:MAG: hypothetical protein KIS67_16305 [Verrucomicrobiae bacterium]|nr:hypothetical protein [Verrucomicrobiae bacterium]
MGDDCEINYIDGQPPEVSYVGFQNSYLKTGHSNTVIYMASDDVAIRTMDFYFSTNGGLDWSAIEEGYVPPTPPTYGAVFPWLVPGELALTTDLMLRVVARDTSGNWGEQVAGPYTVLDGSAPSVTLLSPNGGEVWDMGTTQEIRWHMSSANPLAWIQLLFHYDNSVDFVSTTVPVGATAQSWMLPSPFATSSGKIQIRVQDVNGNLAVDFSDAFFTIRDTSAPPPVPWMTPTNITSTVAGDPGERREL